MSERRLSVLHLAFEDHRRPGSGGGAYRTHEVARRLARRHQVTVVTTTWRGARDRVEDGVRYVHVGRPGGYLVEVLSYFLALPFVLRRHDADVVVEDFAAPMSSALVPLYERRRPVVALVQWLNAEEKSAQYHLPLHLVQRWGVRLHRRFIAVSEDLAERLRRGNPGRGDSRAQRRRAARPSRSPGRPGRTSSSSAASRSPRRASISCCRPSRRSAERLPGRGPARR